MLSRSFRYVVVCTLLLSAFAAKAIVSFGDLSPKEAPILSAALEQQLALYFAYWHKDEPKDSNRELFKSFFFDFSLTPTTYTEADEVAEFKAYTYPADPDKVMAEIIHVYRLRNSDPKNPQPIHAIEDFKRIQRDIVSRGYEPVQDGAWASSKGLKISYDKDSDKGPGPQTEYDSEYEWNHPGQHGAPVSYFHSMTFEETLSFQPRGKPLQGGDEYPTAFLRGTISYRCAKPTAKCAVFSTWFDEAGIRWDEIPSVRGASSSAGGGR